MSGAQSSYLHHIDGLRAFAVAGVVIYHLGLPLPGGFVGVDIFFVISGFLITRILHVELQLTGCVNMRAFLARRVSRLGPALLATIAATLVAAFFILGPQEMQELAASALAASASVSNVHFWLGSGYFDAGSMTKPLLHTWSLGVEEQFYLVWPLVLAFAWGRGRLVPAVTALGVLSFAANLLMFTDWLTPKPVGAQAAFYLMPFRVFEFAIGGLLALYSGRVALSANGKDAATFAGLVGIAASVAFIGEHADFPSWVAVIPCISAGLIIACGSGRLGTALLANGLFRFVGKISYSIYLVHWPVVVLFYARHLRPIQMGEAFTLLTVTMALAVALHYAVERPFRRNFRGAVRVCAACLAFAAPVGSLALVDGFVWRVPENMRAVYERTMQEAALGASSMRAPACFMSGVVSDFAAALDIDACLTPKDGMRPVLLIGDSTSAYAYGGMAETARQHGIDLLQLSMTGCEPRLGPNNDACVDFNEWFFGNLQRFRGTTVVLMAHWGTSGIDYLGQTVQALKVAGIKVYVVGPSLSFTARLPAVFLGAVDVSVGLTRGINSVQMLPRQYDIVLDDLVTAEGAGYFSIIDAVCGDVIPSGCDLMPGGQSLIAMDTIHMTKSNAAEIFRKAEFLK